MKNLEILENFIINNNISSQFLFDVGSHPLNILNENDLEKVYIIDLSGEKLKKIPDFLNIFKNLKELSLNKNEITRIENLDKLVNLEELNLRSNKIEKIENLDSLTKLKKLTIFLNPLKESIYNQKDIENKFINLEDFKIGINNNLNELNKTYLNRKENILKKRKNKQKIKNEKNLKNFKTNNLLNNKNNNETINFGY